MLGTVVPRGGTAIYDTVAEAVPMAQAGSRRKKALVVISDGQDTSSRMQLPELRQLIRETEVLIYAIGIDASGVEPPHSSNPAGSAGSPGSGAPSSSSPPAPSPFPGRRPQTHAAPAPAPAAPARPSRTGSVDRVNVDALRQITDDSGGRTEVIYTSRDLDPATAGIADELSKQYFLGYVSTLPKDGRWHSIELQLRKGNYLVRARKGFIAN